MLALGFSHSQAVSPRGWWGLVELKMWENLVVAHPRVRDGHGCDFCHVVTSVWILVHTRNRYLLPEKAKEEQSRDAGARTGGGEVGHLRAAHLYYLTSSLFPSSQIPLSPKDHWF